MHRSSPRGAVLITLIIAMTLMAVFGAGLYRLVTSSSFGELLANRNDNAYDLARAGIRYGVDLRTFNAPAATFQMPDANHSFTVQITGGVITSTGVVNPGTFLEARRRIVYDASWAPAPIPGVISFSGDMPSFGSPVVNNPLAIQVNPDTRMVNLGGGITNSGGALWYQGSSSVGSCTNGACRLDGGLRAYFDFTFTNEDFSADSTNSADGFTFAAISALNNSRDRSGGAAPGVSQGELMGYAGPDGTTDGLGLRPPKIALEFDTYPNHGSSNVCASGSRNDPTPFSNHVALMFWGDRTLAGSCGAYPKDSYDDNRHAAGGSNGDPANTAGVGDPGYYQGARGNCLSSANSCNWLEDGYPYSARIEIVRPQAANAGGTYDYQINAWVMKRSAVPGLAALQDTTQPYTAAAPQLIRTVSLAQADHDALARVYFGLTEATGGRTQNVTLADLRVSFPEQNGTCTVGVSPATAAYGAAGGSGSAAITPSTACPWWTATVDPASASWLRVTSGGSGSGSGTVGYTVDPSGGVARTGYITIAGERLTVTQGGGCSYAIAPAAASLGAGASTGSVAVTAGAGCSWSATSSAAWLTITAGASGSGNGSVSYTVAANSGPARTGTLTIAGQTFTVNQAGGCSYAIAPAVASPGAGASTGSVAVTAGAGCSWSATSSAAWLTVTAGASGSGNGSVSYAVAANSGPARTGTLTIAGQTFTVHQAGGCSYAITPASISLGRGAVAGNSVTVTAGAGCVWSATSNAAWLTVTAGASGSGSGSVTYAVAANTNPPRSGTITIAGQTFTVHQDGCAALSIATATLPDGRTNVAYSATAATTGGVSPFSWSAAGLPAGLAIGAATGTISGTPSTTGLSTPTVTVTDSCPQTANRGYSVRIKPDSYTITNNTGGTIYRQDGGTCRNQDSIAAGSGYTIPYDDPGVRFYDSRGGGNSCVGSNLLVSGASADAADLNYNGQVAIGSGWTLSDN